MRAFVPGLTVGADPEVFVYDEGGWVKPSDICPAPKGQPMKIDGGGAQCDGMALEFNVDVAHTEDEFASNVQRCLESLREMVKVKGCALSRKVAIYLEEEEVAELSPDSEVSLCDMDNSIYSNNLAKGRQFGWQGWYGAGGHIHVGGWSDRPTLTQRAYVVWAMDMLMMRNPLLQGNSKQEGRRRRGYGEAGSFRAKPYGAEYRSLSNHWIWEESTVREVYQLTHTAVALAKRLTLPAGYKIPDYGSPVGDMEGSLRLVDDGIMTPCTFGEVVSNMTELPTVIDLKTRYEAYDYLDLVASRARINEQLENRRA